MSWQPTLLNSCARAATAAEVRYRIAKDVDLTRVTRIVALDAGATEVVRRVADGEWADAHFLALDEGAGGQEPSERDADLVLVDAHGTTTHLSGELEGADSVVMVATTADAPAAARTIGEAAALRNIMTVGLIFGDHQDVRDAVAILRPFARVLLISRDDDDVAEILTALRA